MSRSDRACGPALVSSCSTGRLSFSCAAPRSHALSFSTTCQNDFTVSERITDENLASIHEKVNQREEERAWMIERLETHLELVLDDNVFFGDKMRDLAATQRILAKARPEEPLVVGENSGQWIWEVSTAVQRTLGLLEHQREIELNLGPDGPKMAVDQLHSVIWNAVAGLRNDGHYRDAVSRASTSVNAHI